MSPMVAIAENLLLIVALPWLVSDAARDLVARIDNRGMFSIPFCRSLAVACGGVLAIATGVLAGLQNEISVASIWDLSGFWHGGRFLVVLERYAEDLWSLAPEHDCAQATPLRAITVRIGSLARGSEFWHRCDGMALPGGLARLDCASGHHRFGMARPDGQRSRGNLGFALAELLGSPYPIDRTGNAAAGRGNHPSFILMRPSPQGSSAPSREGRAGAIVLGCAGMADLAASLSAEHAAGGSMASLRRRNWPKRSACCA